MRLPWHCYLHGTTQPLRPKAPAFPYCELPVQRTTWDAWRTMHPETDVVCDVKPPAPSKPTKGLLEELVVDEVASKVLMFVPGMLPPPVRHVEDVRLHDKQIVIGVSLAGKHRAYPVASLSDITEHIVNDVMGKQSLTVSYCNMTNCVKVYTDPNRRQPLDLAHGGMWKNELVMVADGYRYMHRTEHPLGDASPAFPYEEVPAVRTTWREWKASHPDTEVVLAKTLREPSL